ncbi:unnamed protein product [Urochloa decumbens]|uniref:DUF295 domain-containing protein n=1 Tax=Urochloa decumbens TaxID=240449 RepID=A0ABC9FVQ5_9POAL
MAQAEPPLSWSDLPTELAGLVLCRLPAYSDRVRFGAVCRHWSFSSKQHRLPQPFPCLVFAGGTFFSLPHSESFQFHDSVGFHSSCGEWLFFSHDGTCSLKNPFSKITLTLPNQSCVCPIDEPVEIVNARATQGVQMPQTSLNMEAEMSIQKVVMCSELLVAAIVSMGPLDTVALCRPGADSWFVSALCSDDLLTYMMFYGGKLYAINKFKDLLAIEFVDENDSGKLSISKVERLVVGGTLPLSLIRGGATNINHFLVESRGALLLVRRTIFGMTSDSDEEGMTIKPVGIEFKVFEADISSSQWVVLTSVGDDQALFLSNSYSQSICVSEHKLLGNHIFILDDGTSSWFWADMKSSCLIYNLIDGKAYSPKPAGTFKGEKAPSAWLFPL